MRLLNRAALTLDAEPRPTGIAGQLLPILLVAAIGIGSLIGLTVPALGASLSNGTDALVSILVCLSFVEAGPLRLPRRPGHGRVIGIAMVINFVVVPLIAVAVARLIGGDQPELWLGLIIYLTAPCTDWFLGFTRLAGGNVAAGSVLLPINLVIQLLLCPVYWFVLGAADLGYQPESMLITVLRWFVLPLIIAALARVVVRMLLPQRAVAIIMATLGRLVPWLVAAVIITIFAGQIHTLAAEIGRLPRLVAAVGIFFLIMLLVGHLVRRVARLSPADHILLAMTTSARNAPLMLGLAAATFPDRPIITATIIVGMLIEFPHLIMLTALLRRRN